MGPGFQQHAADSAYNAHYDRPAVLAALGPVTGRSVLDAACGPGLYLRELLERGAEVLLLMPARSWCTWQGKRQQAKCGSTRQRSGGRCPTPMAPSTSSSVPWLFTTPTTARPPSPSSAASCAPAGQRWYQRSTRSWTGCAKAAPTSRPPWKP